MRIRLLAILLVTSLLAVAGTSLGSSLTQPIQDFAIREACDDPALCGAWDAPFEGEEPAVSMALLPDGRVLYWSGVEAVHHEENEDHDHHQHGTGNGDITFFTITPHSADSRVWDPSTGLVITPNHSDGAGDDLFCAGHTILPDGRVLAVGSSEWHILTEDAESGSPEVTPLEGGTDARIFDPATDTWSAVSEMEFGRWYPSLISTPDGDALVASGITNLTMPHTHRGAIELYDVGLDQWTTVSDRPVPLPLYPRITYVPGGPLAGEVFFNTVGTMWGPFGEHPGEGDWNFQQFMDSQGNWHHLGPSIFGSRQHASSVMLPLDADDAYAPKFLTFGGTLQRSTAAIPFTELADLSDVTTLPDGTPVAVANEARSPMNHGRWHLNGVTLPDGHVLALGGAAYDNVVVHGQEDPPILNAEWYDVESDQWTTLAPMALERGYHSTAILLPDASVLVGGHVPLHIPFEQGRETTETPLGDLEYEPQEVETRLEVYKPPYFFQGDRPSIESLGSGGIGQDDARLTGTYGGTVGVSVDVPSGWTLDGFTLVRPGATTHAFDSSQRVINVDHATTNGAAVHVTMPPSGLVAPPGPYMLFVNAVTPSGVTVPSEAVWVDLA